MVDSVEGLDHGKRADRPGFRRCSVQGLGAVERAKAALAVGLVGACAGEHGGVFGAIDHGADDGGEAGVQGLADGRGAQPFDADGGFDTVEVDGSGCGHQRCRPAGHAMLKVHRDEAGPEAGQGAGDESAATAQQRADLKPGRASHGWAGLAFPHFARAGRLQGGARECEGRGRWMDGSLLCPLLCLRLDAPPWATAVGCASDGWCGWR